jgi:hypothetical protein
VLVPLSLASLLTGLVQSLSGAWGLFDHYWVLAKLLMNLFAIGVLLLYMPRQRPAESVNALSRGGPMPNRCRATSILLSSVR